MFDDRFKYATSKDFKMSTNWDYICTMWKILTT